MGFVGPLDEEGIGLLRSAEDRTECEVDPSCSASKDLHHIRLRAIGAPNSYSAQMSRDEGDTQGTKPTGFANEIDLSVVQICRLCHNLLHLCLSSGAPADSAALSEKSSWLLGNFTQNAPCKGDGSDPAELKVRIAAELMESKSGICNFLSVTSEPNRLKANMECHFPAGPLIGDVTFTMKANGTMMLWTATTTIPPSFIDARSDRRTACAIVLSMAILDRSIFRCLQVP